MFNHFVYWYLSSLIFIRSEVSNEVTNLIKQRITKRITHQIDELIVRDILLETKNELE